MVSVENESKLGFREELRPTNKKGRSARRRNKD